MATPEPIVLYRTTGNGLDYKPGRTGMQKSALNVETLFQLATLTETFLFDYPLLFDLW